MLNGIFQLKNLLKILIFFPVIFYFGKRSYIAFDEGFYALQARWILDKGNWIIPLWWDDYALDRTIGLQYLIAKSQDIFGRNMFSAYLPTTCAAIIMLFTTYKLHEELFDKKFALISPLILATSYLWFDYSHLATQDIMYSSLVTVGIYSFAKVNSKENKFYIFLFGSWIGLAFMFKTFLVAVPLLSILPFLYIKRKFFYSNLFLIGLLSGFLPYFIWSYNINPFLDKNIIFYLFEKFNSLSNENTFTKPFYYYLWNIPITFLPWSIFSIVGIIKNAFERKNRYLLTFYPLILVLIISIFSTKTPYYPLQISSILALNSFTGIKFLFYSKKYNSSFIFFTSKFIPFFLICLIFVYYFFYLNTVNFTNRENTFLILGLILFAISWTFLKGNDTFKKFITFLIIGPYLLTSLLLQSGLFTDRSRELRETLEHISSLDIVKNQVIKVDRSGIKDSAAGSKIIRISLLTPHLGGSLESISNLKSKELAWSTEPNKKNNIINSYEIVFEDQTLNPWKLILKK